MSKMKYSGVKWIGDIPIEWKVTRLSTYKDTKSSYPIGDGDHGTVTPDDYIDAGVPYIRVQNLGWESKIDFDNVVYISEELNKKNKKSILYPGDILIAKTGATIGKIGIIPDEVKYANTTSSVGKVSIDKKYSNKYVYYSLLCDSSFQQMWDKASMKSAQPGFNIEDLVKFIICFPNAKEQKLIANYLDDKVEKIDKILIDLYSEIDILNNYKKQLVNEILTKGLDKGAKHVDSGNMWIGDIPSHWSVKRMKYLISEIKVGPFGSALSGDDIKSDGNYWVYNQRSVLDNNFNDTNSYVDENKFKELKSFIVKPGDILLTTRGTIGKVAIVPNKCEIGILHPCLIRFKTNEQMIKKELIELIFNESSIVMDQIMFKSNATTIDVIYSYNLKDIVLPLIPMDEQLEIIKYINIKRDSINNIIESKKKQIEQIEQYKKSVIYEYVTGKKRVEGAEELYG